MATPVGVAEHEGKLLVVCDDGAVYRCENAFDADPQTARWTTLPPVPNTEFQERLQRMEKQSGGGLQWLARTPT